MTRRLALIALVLTTSLGGAAQARDFEMGGDGADPYSIMKPEPGTAAHRRATGAETAARRPHASLLGREKFVGKLHRRPGLFTARSSSGSVLPAPLPRTKLIPPEGSGVIAAPALPREQVPTMVPGAPSVGAVPNLSHGPETFQDRASRCSFQQGLYGVPGSSSTQYMGACVQ